METIGFGIVASRLVVATLAGMILGFDRERREKAAGLRTVSLVALGSASMVLAALEAQPSEGVRMAAGVVTGVGFLGAGAIIRERGEVIGLTSAATVWAAAALGISAAFGAFGLTAIGTALTVIVLAVLWRVDLGRIQLDERIYEVTFDVHDWDESSAAAYMTEAGLDAALLSVSWFPDRVVAAWRAVGRMDQHERAAASLPSRPHVSSFTMKA